ncbi:hypothetical protein [Mesorhizobium sp. M7A.F.Ca.MR.245.00.0.0]|uniref:hypothetical protein n=1 Tax=Mesorhizobium sp. M7A.F.Ca.MR.245.00.0.0 TaxID=2496778 RepID=UPI000FCB8399|nr:hypothetical protein [Mesorhizobium sp. M7A.F.Ca.MR.245.00.0.0]RUV16910.1 hypothetical protein EOB80_29115 [Mesorhizobium sp. M7A.F.Ca.MR.245.00.0.0]RUV52829.1 hypothetical protein EOB77_04840 [Mesorhizobium sp. M7A.F.Ca.MR.228.00.0.0]
MPNFFFPCIGITKGPLIEDTAASPPYLLKRKWETTTFDIATLAAKHSLNFSWHLMDAFLSHVNYELVVMAGDRTQACEQADLCQAMLYVDGASPFIMALVCTHSVNEYSGINSRDSISGGAKLPEELRVGLTSNDGKVEAWLHQPALACLTLPDGRIPDGGAAGAMNAASLWPSLEKKQPRLKTARVALQTAPMIMHRGSSLLHIWQGIEALFPDVRTELSFRLALLIAQLAKDITPRRETYQRSRKSYDQRSKAAHGGELQNGPEAWVEGWNLLCLCMKAIMARGGLPDEQDLIGEALT